MLVLLIQNQHDFLTTFAGPTWLGPSASDCSGLATASVVGILFKYFQHRAVFFTARETTRTVNRVDLQKDSARRLYQSSGDVKPAETLRLKASERAGA